MTHDEIVNALRENAEWCGANEYEIPLCMGDNQRAAADLIESLQAELAASRCRADAAVEDLTKLATKPITPCHSCAKTCVFPASLAPECQPQTWCREWQWRGPQEAGEGERGAYYRPLTTKYPEGYQI